MRFKKSAIFSLSISPDGSNFSKILEKFLSRYDSIKPWFNFALITKN
jgi:hypothetical protein